MTLHDVMRSSLKIDDQSIAAVSERVVDCRHKIADVDRVIFRLTAQFVAAAVHRSSTHSAAGQQRTVHRAPMMAAASLGF